MKLGCDNELSLFTEHEKKNAFLHLKALQLILNLGCLSWHKDRIICI